MTRGRRVPRAGRGHQRSARGEESVATLTIEGIAAGGDGVGRIGALVVFVPRTAPGDEVQIAYRTHANHARGRLLQVLDASPARVEPPCRHYIEDRCGGCQVQHMSAASQRNRADGSIVLKRSILKSYDWD